MFRRKLFTTLWPAFAAAAIFAESAHADVTLASPFTDHLVLQQGQPVPVWGWADSGEKVTVSFAGQSQSTTAEANGTWKIQLGRLSVSADPRELTVAGKNTLTLHDVLVGEVWLASGQSNMDFTVAKTEKYYFAGVINEAEEVAAANHPQIRMFTGEWKRSYAPERTVQGAWKVCTPENVREFSAIGYFFARALQRELNVPVGIVTLTYGASTAQAWIRREAIANDPRLNPALEEFDAKVKAFVPPTPEEAKNYEEAVAKAKAEKQRRPRNPKPDPVQDQHNPTVMFNGMIAPFVGFGIRGVIWYQGESITGAKELFPVWNETLIKDWRKLWDTELPFYFCQLAAHNAASNGPEVRALQAEALKLPATGMAVTIDIGDPKDVHPHNKAPVGERLMRIALANVYGKKIEFSGPVFESSAVENGALRLKFYHVDGGLVAKDGALKTFEIAGADGKFVPAEAIIDRDTLVVRAASVPAPVAARYAWSPYPEGCNFYNAAGLPAAPFRTDKK
jgi:sialate O-acetylesterase